MACQYAYTRTDVEYVLCKKEGSVNVRDRKSVIHATCPHQSFCNARRRYILNGEAINCIKLKETLDTAREGDVGATSPTNTVKSTVKKKSAKKAKQNV